MTGRHGRGIRIAVAAAVAAALVAGGGVVAVQALDGGGGSAPVAAPSPSPDPVVRVDPSIVHASEEQGKTVNLTIDDGPDPTWTPKVLDLLAQHHAKAVFCMVGPNAQAHPALVKQVVAGGHRLCDHSVHHDTGMDKKPLAYQQSEILDAQRMIEQAAGDGAEVQYYRAPGGAFTPESRQIAAEHGMRPLGWNVDPDDWKRPGVDAIVAAVQNGMAKGTGPTVLFHDGGGDRSQTYQALERLLPWFEQQGYHYGFPQV
ncbi:polysaccharide deacetylase family protein [Kitasatospora sp. NPDC096147]|uniref:polysaccharide deacetylase family protein n=1 Tax=Kitasatospora sp. NPDC096147 TaxID=3364093 RepID=UPI0037FFDB19